MTKQTLAEKQAEQKKIVVDYYRSLPVLKHAAAAARISRQTLDRWRKDDPNFETELNLASATFFGQKAKKAKPEFLLERLDKETFKETKEIVGDLNIALVEFVGSDEETDENQDTSTEAV